MNPMKPDNNKYRGQNLIRYLLLPASACLAVILAIAFLLHLIGADNHINSSEISPDSHSATNSETIPLSYAAGQTETVIQTIPQVHNDTITDNPGETLNETQGTEAQIAVPTPVPQYEYSAQNTLELYDGIADPRTVDAKAAIDPYSLEALVNKGFSLTTEFEPAELVPAEGFDWFMLHPVAADAWSELRDTCLQETGIILYMTSAYRSYDVQNMLFQSALKRKGIVNSVGYNAYQGRSEHQLGLAIDIMDSSTMKNSLSFAQTQTYSWMLENAARFGFILRYPEHKVHITDYCYEPWHFRYVGIELAHYLTDNDLTLEEYYGLGPLSNNRSESAN